MAVAQATSVTEYWRRLEILLQCGPYVSNSGEVIDWVAKTLRISTRTAREVVTSLLDSGKIAAVRVEGDFFEIRLPKQKQQYRPPGDSGGTAAVQTPMVTHAAQEVLDALSDGPIVDLNGRATAILAARLGINSPALSQRIRAMVETGVIPPPLVHSKRTYEIRRHDQSSQYEAMRDVAAAAASEARREMESHLPVVQLPNGDTAPRGELFKSAASVSAAPMAFVWRRRIMIGEINVFAGKPGRGKSSLLALIAAELSQEGIGSIIGSIEDDVESVTVPRLQVAAAKLDKISLLSPDLTFSFPRDLSLLRQMIQDTGAKVVFLDPLEGFFKNSAAMHRRETLMAIRTIVRETGTALVGIHHTTKGGGDPITLIGGPQGGLSGVARAVYLYGIDPDNYDRRALACAKLNGTELPATLIFDHKIQAFTADGRRVEATRLVVRRESNVRASNLDHVWQRVNEKRQQECAEWLVESLVKARDCMLEVDQIRASAEEVGFNWGTVTRAKIDLELVVHSVEMDGEWIVDYWALPKDHPLYRPER